MSTRLRVLAAAVFLGIGGVGAMLAAPGSTKVQDEARSVAAPDAVRKVVVARGVIDVEGGIIQIAASRDGVVREVRVEEGTAVGQGDVLAVIDDRVARAALAVVKAELAQAEAAMAATRVRIAAARREVMRLAPLKDAGATPTRTFDQAVDTMHLADVELEVQAAAVETSRTKVAQAELELEQRTVRAPVDGTIVRRLARPGDGASTLNVTTLFWLAPATPRIGRIEIEELSAEQVKPGQPVEVTVDGGDTHRLSATVQRVGRAFGPRRATVYDARERADLRFVEAVLAFQSADVGLLLGQRIIARIAVK